MTTFAQYVNNNLVQHQTMFANLYQRYLMESQYEDKKEYLEFIQSNIPNVVKMTFKPFAIFIKVDNELTIKMHMVRNKNTARVNFTTVPVK